ncbi:MAG TPA: tyrosine/phenylalanine carboxypeptidase domain-containing protein, partial [Longimicrobiaceae bacterium]|nr:tyrosine/phenylalanine carboxypeptidase domain-containing protein [Longimicrobiaceae bacterium]
MEEIAAAIHRREPIRRVLPGDGRISIDRNLPYLIVYRHPDSDDSGTVRLVVGEASYLIADNRAEIPEIVRSIAEAGSEAFGAFLILEIWAGPDPDGGFVIRCPEGPAPATVATLEDGLARLRPEHEVAIEITEQRQPPGMQPLLSIRESWDIECLLLGLEIPPMYRAPGHGEPYPVFLRTFRRELSNVIRQAIYEFIRVQTRYGVQNYQALGTRTLQSSVWEADRALSDIERSYQFLLLVSAINEKESWQYFKQHNYERNPEFHHRLLPVDPDLLKRRLFGIALEQIDDPAMAFLLRDKREELDKQISMLEERGTPNFLASSMRLYGRVDEPLLNVARTLLEEVGPATGTVDQKACVDAVGFEKAAAVEFAAYAAKYPEFSSTVEIRPDMAGLLVSAGNLLIGKDLLLSPDRVDALVQHEVGTHVLTYANGSAQPLGQLSLGLADYDETQEGLAVLAEYLVGGLDLGRIRLLAGRVIAADSVEQRAEFVETFRLLRDLEFSAGAAYGITERVHACGGFTRDLIYL